MKTINGKALLSNLIIDVDKSWGGKKISDVKVSIGSDRSLMVNNALVYDLQMPYNNEIIKTSSTEKTTSSVTYVSLKRIDLKMAGLYGCNIEYKISDAAYQGSIRITFDALTPYELTGINNIDYLYCDRGPYLLLNNASILIEGKVDNVLATLSVRQFNVLAKDYYSQPIIILE